MAFGSRVLSCIGFALALANLAMAKEWHGIVPLRSTRADVVRTLSQCSDQREACAFSLGKEKVFILFSGGLPKEYRESATRLPQKTVMFIEIEEGSPARLKDLGINKHRFKEFNPTEPYDSGFRGYVNEAGGEVVKTYKGKVIRVDYIAANNDLHLCPAYYADPKSFVEVYLGHVPIVDLQCPPGPVVDGEPIKVSGWSDFHTRQGLEWTVTSVKIIAGQNTYAITIDTTGRGWSNNRGDGNGYGGSRPCGILFLSNTSR
jgi:hypothetical protein